jgi:4-alpha-glucanotransferase
MIDKAILDRARDAGIAVDWIDADDKPRRVSLQSLERILEALDPGQAVVEPPLLTTVVGRSTAIAGLDDEALAELELEDGARQSLTISAAGGLPPVTTPGYHKLRYGAREITLAVAPSRCFTLADLSPSRKLCGLAVQVYSLRRQGDGGIGDTTAVAMLARAAAAHGADAIALSPMHSLFPSDLSRYSPYSPSSRLFLNPLLADPAAVLGEQRVAAFRPAIDDGEGALIDWPKAARAKYGLLLRLFDDFTARDLAANTPLAVKFRAFQRKGGVALDEHARFEARQAGSSAPALYYAFLQWLAAEAQADAQAAARAAGMRIGLIVDLAIGVDRGGSQVCSRSQDFLTNLSIGAPPDMFNPQGQDWGLTSFSPHGLKATGFESFIATLRAGMRHAGGVRIDHAMGLLRLWVLPRGASPGEGAYLAYPVDDLLRLLALESHRNRCVVIGEDLGTVPAGFRQRCREAGIAGMDVLWFQRDRERFLTPAEWRDDAVGMTTTHDLPTVTGWWRGVDLDRRRGIGKASDDEIERRSKDRDTLWKAFTAADSAYGPPPAREQSEAVVDAAMDFVARAPSPLALAPLEDIIGIAEQPNLPGTVDEHPNWRRRFDRAADALLRQPAAARRLRILAERRS